MHHAWPLPLQSSSCVTANAAGPCTSRTAGPCSVRGMMRSTMVKCIMHGHLATWPIALQSTLSAAVHAAGPCSTRGVMECSANDD
eukprot:1159961-Pelagomonas_calceolata.AAC.4